MKKESWKCSGECHEPFPVCGARAQNGKRCTRNAGHVGKHEACGLFDEHHPMHVWGEEGMG